MNLKECPKCYEPIIDSETYCWECQQELDEKSVKEFDFNHGDLYEDKRLNQ